MTITIFLSKFKYKIIDNFPIFQEMSPQQQQQQQPQRQQQQQLQAVSLVPSGLLFTLPPTQQQVIGKKSGPHANQRSQ